MTTTTYNGWTNRETWLVNLWISNEQTDYLYWRERTEEIIGIHTDDEHDIDKDAASYELANALKEWIEESTPLETGMFADLLNYAIAGVDWHEIATSMINDEIDNQ